MEIFINQQTLDVTLDGQETIGGIIQQLASWVESSGEYIIETLIDDMDVSSGLPADIAKRPGSSATKICLTTCPALEFRVRRLTIMDNYLSLLEEAILKSDLQGIKAITEEYPYLQNQLNEEITGVASDSPENELHTIIEALGQETQELTNDQRRSIGVIIQMTRAILDDRRKEIIHPLQSANQAAQHILKLIPDIMEVSVQLQSNEEKNAMQTVFSLTELLGKLLRTISIAAEDPKMQKVIPFTELQQAQQNIHQLLRDFEDAFAANDTVTVGDILEYELAPVLEQFCHTVIEYTPAADSGSAKDGTQ
ncbi:MAG: sensor histidine kinase [Spirochaetaceae bacterium]|nr:MAG: sensor histidine kinase [Spirochaetaceae bacterium]